MAFEEIKDNIDDIKVDSEEFLRSSMNYYRLWGFKVTAKAGSIFMTLLLVGLFIMISVLFFSLSAAFAIGECLDSRPIGFLIVGVVYLLITLLAYLFRKQLVEKPLIKKLSEIIFND